MRLGQDGDEHLLQNEIWSYFFNISISITKILSIGISLEQKEIMRYCGPAFLLLDLFCLRYIFICTFQGGFENLKLNYVEHKCMLLMLPLRVIICIMVRKLLK